MNIKHRIILSLVIFTLTIIALHICSAIVGVHQAGSAANQLLDEPNINIRGKIVAAGVWYYSIYGVAFFSLIASWWGALDYKVRSQ